MEHDIPIIEPAIPPNRAVRVDQAVLEALSLLPKADRLTVLVNDPQRDTATGILLEALFRLAPPSGIRMLVATGSHSFAAAQRASHEGMLIGACQGGAPSRSAKAEHVPAIAWHECMSPDLVSIGGVWSGHPWLLEWPHILALGSVEPHYFAGFTGAHKTCTIGCAAFEDIQANHAHALDPESGPCRLEGNPVHDGIAAMLRALERMRPIASVNLVQTAAPEAASSRPGCRNGGAAPRRIVGAFGGSPDGSLRAAAQAAGETFVRQIDSPADALILDVTGPLGESFYQADKGIKNNEWAVRDGGCLVLVAPCGQGIGQAHFVNLLREAPDYRAAVELVNRRGYRLGDHKAVRLRYLTDPACRGVRVFVVSPGLSEGDAATLGLTKAAGVDDALAAAGLSPSRHTIYRVRDAGNLVVSVSGRPELFSREPKASA
ncbi:MAG: lactate racemase domain-containing protein [Phycisphaerae bacterium]